MKSYKEFMKLTEDMVAGDSGGSVQNIASGTTTGAVVNKGPEQIPAKKQKSKKSEEV